MHGGALVERHFDLETSCSGLLQVLAAAVSAVARLAMLALSTMLLAVVPVAATETWSVITSTGTVLVLIGDRWSDLPASGDIPEGVPVRTLKGATVSLSCGGYLVVLAPESAARLDRVSDSAVVLTQFAGTATFDGEDAKSAHLLVVTSKLTVDLARGAARVAVLADTGKVDVASGAVTVVDAATGAKASVAAGNAFVAPGVETPGVGTPAGDPAVAEVGDGQPPFNGGDANAPVVDSGDASPSAGSTGSAAGDAQGSDNASRGKGNGVGGGNNSGNGSTGKGNGNGKNGAQD